MEYKNAMQSLYLKPLETAEKYLNRDVKISSYGDVPIPRDWHGIEKRTWEEWGNPSISKRDLTTSQNRTFYDRLDFNSTSSYYFYKRGQNLAYCLFQIESNKTIEDKPLYQFVWMRYTGSLHHGEPISESLAEATAIFPFFSGANGLWLWEQSKNKDKYTEGITASYEAFIRGLERLSAYKKFFTGSFKLVIPKAARDHFVDKDPIWRGVVKNQKILIAAQNPYAKDSEKTFIELKHGKWSKTIKLNGKETLLQEFRLNK
jgi:hypothetical protein